MKSGYQPVIFASTAELTSLNNLPGVRVVIVDANGAPTGEVREGQASGAPLVTATSVSVAAALATITIADWQAATAMTLNEVRRATATAGTIELGDLIRSNSARTTGATFDATEAGNWTEVSPDLVTSVAGRNGAVVLTKADVGLASVDNTTDAGKPVSTAQQTALDLKAPLASPTFTGAPAVPTAAVDINTTQAASTAWVNAQLSGTLPLMNGTATVGSGTRSVRGNHVHPTDTSRAGTAVATTSVDGLMAAADKTKLAGVATGATANTVNNTLTSTSTTEALSAAQGKVLQDGKQATLVSGTNLRPVNGASLLGSSNLTIAADLPGGAVTTVTNEGLATTGAPTSAVVGADTVLTFNATGSFTVPIGVTGAQVLVVAGGGGGGRYGGGGGAGGFASNALLAVTPGASIPVTVGGGGAAAASRGVIGGNGTNSIFSSITAIGGGGGGSDNNSVYGAAVSNGANGGCGGGAAYWTAATGGTGSQGNAGGLGHQASTNPGGGGGASAAGGNATAGAGGAGGAGQTSTITGASVTYAGGGGGCSGAGAGALGGAGGGGDGAGTGASTAGTANTGGGGGGGTNNAAAAGGSGVVIIRFATQTRSYQALISYADNAAAIAAGRLVGQFYKKTVDGSVQQVA